MPQLPHRIGVLGRTSQIVPYDFNQIIQPVSF